ncbi:hypothetical protein [Pseudacidovorax intermedius]|uniref:Uncharacterized protein n=1 Tax=Pseudacidovorax intermedius TaxID=433924 RepID=A0A370F5D7_9BURK|nr:hypothetical protein [Pseudacidovorax intermedius]RDI18600.1 hypothetical protein DFR41_11448 [Pseudacidovorax intermedius]
MTSPPRVSTVQSGHGSIAGMPAAPRPGQSTWPATLALAAAMVLYVGGLQLWDQLTPSARAVAQGQPLTIGPARFVPAPGWQMDVARSRPGQSLVLVKSGHSFSVQTAAWHGDADGLLRREQRLLERGYRLRVEGEPSGFFTDWGLQGTTFAYYGARMSGRLWLVMDEARATVVTVDFYGPNQDTDAGAQALTEAQDMLASMDLGAA